MKFFGFILVGFHLASWIYQFVFYQILEIFGHFFFEFFFSLTVCLFSWKSDDTNSSSFVLSHQSQKLFFQHIFFLLFRLYKFYWSILSPLILSSVIPTLLSSPSSELIFLILYFSVLSSSFWLFYNMSLLKFSTFSFVPTKFKMACWCIFIMVSLKFLLDNSNNWFFSVLETVDYFLSFMLSFIWSDEWFSIVSWPFWIYGMRHWSLFNFLEACFLVKCSPRAEFVCMFSFLLRFTDTIQAKVEHWLTPCICYARILYLVRIYSRN